MTSKTKTLSAAIDALVREHGLKAVLLMASGSLPAAGRWDWCADQLAEIAHSLPRGWGKQKRTALKEHNGRYWE